MQGAGFWVVLALLVALAGLTIYYYNRLVFNRARVAEAWSAIDVQLKRRADLIPNLVETVKGYATHEKSTLDAVIAARNAAQGAGSVHDKAAAEQQLSGAVGRLLALGEAYPDLKASENFQQLQTELTRTEDQLAFARQYYNDASATLNRTMVTIPWSLFAGMSGVEKATFYDAPEAHSAPPTVSFD